MRSEAISLARSLCDDIAGLRIEFSDELHTESSCGSPIKQDFKKITKKQANMILWEAASDIGIDLNYLIPKSSSLAWPLPDFSAFMVVSVWVGGEILLAVVKWEPSTSCIYRDLNDNE